LEPRQTRWFDVLFTASYTLIVPYYIRWSNVDTEEFDKDLSLAEYHHQASNARATLKDAITEATTYGTSYKLEVVTARVHTICPEVFENPVLEQE
jgi:hypothetical protein